jgi:hypothetical protein
MTQNKKPVDTIGKPSSIEEALAQQAAKDAGTNPSSTPTAEATPAPEATPTESTPAATEPTATPAAAEAAATPATEPAPEPAPAVEPTPEANAAVATPEATPAAEAQPGPSAAETSAAQAASQASSQFEQLFPEPQVVVSGPPTWIWWILLVVGAAGVIFLAYDLTRQQLSATQESTPSPTTEVTVEPSPTPSATATATPEPTSTPSPTATAQAGTIRVLNGTTTNGLAAATRDELIAASLSVRTIGNATNRTYTKTIVYYSSGNETLAQNVATALGVADTPTESTLAAPDAVLVVVGSDRN